MGFTLKLLGYLKLTPKIIYVDTQKKLGNIPKSYYDNNILKNNENNVLNSLPQKISEEEQEANKKRMAEITVKAFANNPTFANIVADLKNKYGL